jgi:hypothetical protein
MPAWEQDRQQLTHGGRHPYYPSCSSAFALVACAVQTNKLSCQQQQWQQQQVHSGCPTVC